MDIETEVSNRTMIPKAKLALTRSNESFFSLAVCISFGFDDDFSIF